MNVYEKCRVNRLKDELLNNILKEEFAGVKNELKKLRHFNDEMRSEVKSSVSMCAASSMRGNLNMLKLLRQHGFAWDESTVTNAFCNYHKRVLKYALENGCPFDTRALVELARINDDLTMMRFFSLCAPFKRQFAVAP